MAISNASFSLYPFCRCRSTQSSNPLARNGMGSSPRMRGALGNRASGGRRDRIIPAYAGSTRPRSRATFQLRDHPRVCGEHVFHVSPREPHEGSSPRMRGAPFKFSFRDLYHGIIPAYAGSTPTLTFKHYDRPDHPRVCGEHGLEGLRCWKAPWIIPAYAGSTWCSSRRSARCRDHPRVCGEHSPSALQSP